MSPEQIDGKPLDSRRDCSPSASCSTKWRPGASRFRLPRAEPGRRDPFERSDFLRSLKPDVPPQLERIINTALEKRPEDRWQSTHDVARQLRWLAEGSSAAESVIAAPRPRRWRAPATIGIVALLAAAATWKLTTMFGGRRAQKRALSLQFSAPPGIVPAGGFDVNKFAISPDGRRLAFVAQAAGKRSIFVRDLGSY